MTKSSKRPPDNRLNAPFFCSIFPCTYISMVPAGPEEDEGSCYWMPDQHIARSGLPHSPQMRRCGMSQKTAAAKPHFLHPAVEERAAWPGLPQSHITAMQCQQQKIHAAMHCPEELLLQLPCHQPAQVPACWGEQAGQRSKDGYSQRQPALLPRSQRLMRLVLQTDFRMGTELKLSPATSQALSNCSF